jgi:hypothetical protein
LEVGLVACTVSEVEFDPGQTKSPHTKAIKDLRDVPDEYLNDLQRRAKAQTLSGKPFFDQAGAAAELGQYNLPAYFFDFVTIQFAVPIWQGDAPLSADTFSIQSVIPVFVYNASFETARVTELADRFRITRRNKVVGA